MSRPRPPWAGGPAVIREPQPSDACCACVLALDGDELWLSIYRLPDGAARAYVQLRGNRLDWPLPTD